MPFGIGQKSQAATRGRSPKNLPTLPADRLNEKVYVTIDGRQRKRLPFDVNFRRRSRPIFSQRTPRARKMT
jgi:hypothetical protein